MSRANIRSRGTEKCNQLLDVYLSKFLALLEAACFVKLSSLLAKRPGLVVMQLCLALRAAPHPHCTPGSRISWGKLPRYRHNSRAPPALVKSHCQDLKVVKLFFRALFGNALAGPPLHRRFAQTLSSVLFPKTRCQFRRPFLYYRSISWGEHSFII
ncbi:hypothetical protein VTI28DRAFT_425 [Corynascus sepedonium]